MRRSLLVCTAIMGGVLGWAALATAAGPPPSELQGTLPTKASAGAYAIENNNDQAKMLDGPVANPTPGTMVIRIGARVQAGFVAGWTNLNNYTAPGGASNELYPYNFYEWARLYPGMDAMAANGLRYGGAVELRQNFGPPTSTTTSSGGSAYSTSQTVYVRREFLYLAGENWGLLRFGEADGLIGIFDAGGSTTGVYLSPSGTFVAGDLETLFPSNAWMTAYFAAQSGNEYANMKLVYLSPSFNGFDFGLQYAPDGFNGYANGSCTSAASDTGCPNLASTATPNIGSRMKDQFAAGMRYNNVLGGVKVLAYGVYMTSGHTNYTGSPTAAGLGSVRSGTAGGYNGQFDGLNLGMMGFNLTYAGFSLFGNTMLGAYNGILALRPQGGVGGAGWGVGVRYANGPYTIGGAYTAYDSQGDVRLVGVSQRHEQAMVIAGTYTVAAGLTVFADYQYGTRYQGGYNFATGENSSSVNHVQAQGLLLGTVMKW